MADLWADAMTVAVALGLVGIVAAMHSRWRR